MPPSLLKMTGRLPEGRLATSRSQHRSSPAANHAFDVTPARLVTGLITERGICAPPKACCRFSRARKEHDNDEKRAGPMPMRSHGHALRTDRHARRSGACASTRRGCSAAIRASCCMAAATPPSKRTCHDIMGETIDVLCVKGSGWDMAVIEPAGLPAVRLAPLLQARARTAVRRRHGRRPAREPARPRFAESRPSKRCCTPSCRTNSSTTPIPPRFSRSPISPTARRSAASVRRRVAFRALCHAGLRAGQSGRRRLRRRPRRRRPAPAASTASSPSARRAREAYERMIALVEPGRSSGLRAKAASRSSPARLPEPLAAPGRDRPHPARRCRHPIRGEGRTIKLISARFRALARHSRPSSTARARRYCAAAASSTPDHTIRIKNGPLVAAGAGRGQARRVRKHRRDAVAALSSREYQDYFAAPTPTARRRQPSSIRCRAWFLSPGLGLFGLGASAEEPRIAADVGETPIETDHRRRIDRPLPADSPKPISSTSNIGRSNRPSSPRRRRSRLPARSPWLPAAAGAIGAATAQALRRARAPKSPCSISIDGGPAAAREDAASRRSASPATSPMRLRARRLRRSRQHLRRRRHRRLQRRRGLAGHDRRRRRRAAAPQSSSSTSSPIRASPRTRCAS